MTENAHYWTSQLHLHQRSGHMHGHILGSYWGVFTLKTSDGFILYEHPWTVFLALHRIGLGLSERDKNELYDVAKLPTCGVKTEPLRLPVEGRRESWIWNCVLLCVCVCVCCCCSRVFEGWFILTADTYCVPPRAFPNSDTLFRPSFPTALQ